MIDVAAKASTRLEEAGIEVAVVGGSAITAHVPEVYTSHDIDFAAINGTTRRAFAEVIATLGFAVRGREYVHPESRFSLDLVADTPYIDQRPILKFATIESRFGPVRAYLFEDAIADRVAAFVHWGDSESLDVAERAVRAKRSSTSWKRILRVLSDLDASEGEGARRLDLATNRLRRMLEATWGAERHR